MLWAVVGTLAAYLLVCFLLAHSYLRPLRHKPGACPENLTQDHAEILGLRVSYWKGRAQPTQNVAFLIVHGYSGSPEEHFPMASHLVSLGFPVVVPELPAHATHPYPRTGLGTREHKELLAWRAHMADWFPNIPVVAYGVSMGGAAVWLASQADPKAFKAVCTEGCFATLKRATDAWFDRHFLGSRYLLYPVRVFGQWISGFKESQVQPVIAAASWKGSPCAILHGEHDRLFGGTHAQELATAAGVEVRWLKETRHAGGWAADPNTIESVLLELAQA